VRLRIRVEAVKQMGIVEIAKEFRKSIRLEEIKEDPLKILLEMRNRL